MLFLKKWMLLKKVVVKVLNNIESEGFNVEILINNANPKLDNKSTLKNKDELENLSINGGKKI